ncbi:MAG: arginyltransferase [Proteobacteria bacterium]|nr:arginyltransferase [Pseudomonadota bacterium]
MTKKELLVYDGLQRCPYLQGQVARMPLYRQLRRLSPSETDERLANAERRVGHALYRTACPTCSACKGIRVPVGVFQPTKSQRRVWRRWNERVRVEIGTPSYTPEKLELFNRHKRVRGLHDPNEPEMTPVGYVGWLVHSCMETVEMDYYVDDRLVAVGILDVGATSASSVYFFFDPSPEISKLSPGVFSVLREVAYCRDTGRNHLYLGLWVRDCPQLAYKSLYFPHERLEDGDWRRFESADAVAQSEAREEQREEQVAVEHPEHGGGGE